MITKLTKHDNCDVQIVFGQSLYHTAHLECCDANCTHKTKWIQWISGDAVDALRQMGLPVVIDRDYLELGKKRINNFNRLYKPEELGI